MLCSSCYKKIPEGQEVAKTTGFWKVNGWGRWGNEIFCKKCAKLQDNKDRIFMFFLISAWLLFTIFGIIFFIFTLKNR